MWLLKRQGIAQIAKHDLNMSLGHNIVPTIEYHVFLLSVEFV